MKKYITLKDVLIDRIISESQFIGLSVLEKNIPMKILKYNTFDLIEQQGIKIFQVQDDSGFRIYKDLIDITADERFSYEGIKKGQVNIGNVIVEGADGTGKSTVTRNIALRDAILCEDRNVAGITRTVSDLYMPLDEKIKKVYSFVSKCNQKEILFLILSDLNEMRKRIYCRTRISEWDLRAEKTQQEYIKVYNAIKELRNVHIYDVSGKTFEDVEGVVLKYAKK